MALRRQLREFLRLQARARVPDLSTIRSRLPHAVHTAVFTWVLGVLDAHGLIKGERIGASTMEANAALRSIVRRSESYREMLTRMACESGIETPSADDLVRLDRQRKGKKLSNADWVSKPQAKIAKMKDGTTHLAYQPEHAVDLDTGAVVAADRPSGAIRRRSPARWRRPIWARCWRRRPARWTPRELVADKGYHSRAGLGG